MCSYANFHIFSPAYELNMENKKISDNISFTFCDFNSDFHCNKVLELIDHYMSDPMGNSPLLNNKEKIILLEGLKNHSFSFILFVSVEEVIVGMVTCFINFSTFKARHYLNIHDIIILKDYRGKGLGRKLLEKCISISMDRNYCKITLEVREDNYNAKQLYKNLGFNESEPVMHFWTKPL